MANTLHLKASRTQILSHFPNKTFGKEGDIVACNVKGKGLFLCIKANGKWHTANKLEDINKIHKTPLDVVARKIKIKNIKNSLRANKFVVAEDDGDLRYIDSNKLLENIDSDGLTIDYKEAYCSLGQYTNKEECEANNGTWYYSNNDSHDNISSTAENQLLTIGQSIGTLDSEPTLLYDGSTLEIKRNTNYDDNWQTSSTENLLKLSYDSDTFTTIGLNSQGNLTFDVSGDTIYTVEGGGFTIQDNGGNGVPNLTLKNYTTGGTEGGKLTFLAQRGEPAVDAVDGDVLGTIEFTGNDDGTPSKQVYASIVSTILDSESGGEQGQIDLKLAENDGTLTSAYTAFGTTTNNEFRHMWYGPEYRFYKSAGNNSFAGLQVTSNRGATTLSTSDESGSTSGNLTFSPEGKIINDADIGGIYIKEHGSAGADTAGEGQLWIQGTTPNKLRFRNDAGDDIKITSGAGLAESWNMMIGGYRLNNNSSSNYYTFYRTWYENWSNADADPSSITYYDGISAFFIAPRAGEITNIKIQGYAADTGATDPFKFYFYKGPLTTNAGSISCTSMFSTSTITPSATNKTWSHTEDFSSNNAFAEDDNLYIWLKKDSTSANQDLYFNINVTGEYT
tara:strand:+ start:361 stop:2217 length:1857 start_codon:yes stop_codon:yes gene_type:complete